MKTAVSKVWTGTCWVDAMLKTHAKVVEYKDGKSVYDILKPLEPYIAGTIQKPLTVQNPRAVNKTTVASDGIHIGTDASEVHYGKDFIVNKYGEEETVYGLPMEGGTLVTESKARTLAQEEIAKFGTNGSANIESGAGNGSIQQVADGVANGFDFTGKNPNATAVDATLTGTIPYGATGAYASSFGGKSSAQGKRSHAEGTTTIAKGNYSHAEGDNSVAIGNDSHAEGYTTTASGMSSHSEGYSSVASGRVAHAEGQETTASGEIAHAEGLRTVASGITSHAEGNNSKAKGSYSHAENNWTIAEGDYSHSEGNLSHAKGACSHAGGDGSYASGENSFAHGEDVRSYYKNQTVFGQFNKCDPNTLFEIGNGTSAEERNNAFEVRKDGTVRVNGKPLEADGGGIKLYLHTIRAHITTRGAIDTGDPLDEIVSEVVFKFISIRKTPYTVKDLYDAQYEILNLQQFCLSNECHIYLQYIYYWEPSEFGEYGYDAIYWIGKYDEEQFDFCLFNDGHFADTVTEL